MTELINIQSVILDYILNHKWVDYKSYANFLSKEMLRNKPKNKSELEKIIRGSSPDFFYFNDLSKDIFIKYFPVDEVLTEVKENISQFETINILFLASNPKDTCRLRLDEEWRSIDRVLRSSDLRDKINIKQEWAVRLNELQAHFLRYRPKIVHFSGHGSEDSKIILEDENGESIPVPPKALTKLFKIFKDEITVVVLNACFSEKQAKSIAKHIPYVLGMADTILDKTAITFSAAFYQAIGYGQTVEAAFELALNQLDLESIPESDIPVLLKK